MVIARNGDSNFYMTNSGMSMTLVDNNNNNLHQATWGNVNSGKDYEQNPTSATANWISTNNPTPGEVNTASGSNNLIPGDLIITEAMPNPWPSDDNATWPGGEWVEILNTGNADIDLTGYSIEDAAGNVPPLQCQPFGQRLANHDDRTRRASHRGGQRHQQLRRLNNGVESLTLKWPNGKPISGDFVVVDVQGFP